MNDKTATTKAKAASTTKKADKPAKATPAPKADKKAPVAKTAAPKADKPTGTGKGIDALKHAATVYEKHKDIKTAGGNVSVDSGDDVATKLRGKPLSEVYDHAAKVLETTVAELQKKYGHLNVGMQRMNLGNRIRGVLNAK